MIILLFRNLDIDECGLNDDELLTLSPVILLLEQVCLGGNTELTEKGYGVMVDNILNSKQNKLKKLRFDGLNDDELITLSPVIPMLEVIHLRRNDDITSRGWEQMCDAILQYEGTIKLKKVWLNRRHFPKQLRVKLKNRGIYVFLHNTKLD